LAITHLYVKEGDHKGTIAGNWRRLGPADVNATEVSLRWRAENARAEKTGRRQRGRSEGAPSDPTATNWIGNVRRALAGRSSKISFDVHVYCGPLAPDASGTGQRRTILPAAHRLPPDAGAMCCKDELHRSRKRVATNLPVREGETVVMGIQECRCL
jgi:hypothetical protein